MTSILFNGALLAALTVSINANAAPYTLVENGNNEGLGSLRAALSSGANTIKIADHVNTIQITEGLTYSGSEPLKLVGNGQVIDGSMLQGDADILTLDQGANAAISNLSLVGNGDDINLDPNTPTGGKGIFVSVPISRTGLVKIRLDNVSVYRVGNHGIHVSDCTLGDAFGGGSGGAGEGSPASIALKLYNVHVNGVGFGRADADGVRVDDRGDGDIYFLARNSSFMNVGADGVELDEGNNGSVIADVRHSIFDSNGEYCNVVPVFEGGPCDDDGDRDVDDGFDIDEAGNGSLYASINNTKVTNNFDEGLDFDEEDEGDIQARVIRVYAGDNEDEGIKMSEEGAGDLRANLKRINLVANNGSKEGIELEEANAGDVRVRVVNSTLIGADSETLKVEQTDEGVGRVKLRGSLVILDLDGASEE